METDQYGRPLDVDGSLMEYTDPANRGAFDVDEVSLLDGYMAPEEGDETEAVETPALTLHDILDHAMTGGNIAEMISDQTLAAIGEEAKTQFEADYADGAEWRNQRERAIKATKQDEEKKSFPWEGASNVKYPLLTTASMQFAARTYSAIVPGKTIVKSAITGEDPDGSKRQRGERVADHMSNQLLEQIEGWEDGMDALLAGLPIDGTSYKKISWDMARGRPLVEVIQGHKVTLAPETRDIRTTPRITCEIERFPREVESRIRDGRWLEHDYADGAGAKEDQKTIKFLEQHCWLDLDEDGLTEPYIVILDAEHGKVARIEPRYGHEDILWSEDGQVVDVFAMSMFVPYRFMPDPDGGFNGIGFGKLLQPINEAINTVVNQLFDAGTLSNTQGGFIALGSLPARGGKGAARLPTSVNLAPGEYKPVSATGQNLRDAIVPMTFPGPSPVLFQLLGLLIDAGKEIASIKDITTGAGQANMPATTTLALIEQGMKLFTSIQRRIHRSFREELGVIFKLNSRYLQQESYANVLDDQAANVQADYATGDMDVFPVTDPAMASDQVKMARAQFLMQFASAPGMNVQAIIKRVMDAAGIDDADELFAQPDPAQQQMQLAEKQAEATKEYVDQMIKVAEAAAKVEKDRAGAIKDLASAEAEEAGDQLGEYMAALDGLKSNLEGLMNGPSQPGSNGGMAGVPGGAGIPGAMQGGGGGMGGQAPIGPDDIARLLRDDGAFNGGSPGAPPGPL